jgi:hypothetical protein
MADPAAVPPSILDWIKPIGSYLIIPMFAILVKGYFDILKMAVRQPSGTSEKSVDAAEKERRLQHCEASIIAINSDVCGLGMRIQAHDERFDKMTDRVDRIYEAKIG